jgi:hypothetical protein
MLTPPPFHTQKEKASAEGTETHKKKKNVERAVLVDERKRDISFCT